MNYLIVKVTYGISCILRWLFLSSKTGTVIHNLIGYNLLKLFGPEPKDEIEDPSRLLKSGLNRNYIGIGLQKRIYSMAPSVRKRMMENLGWMFLGAIRRKRLTKNGLRIPLYILISPTYRCNLNCYGCYAKDHKGELSFKIMDRIVNEQEELGIFNVVVVGGEPFLRDDLWQIYERYPRTVFTIYTNGTLIGEKEIKKIVQLGNLQLAVTLGGFREETDKLRGEGVYERVIDLLKLCQLANILCGVSVIVTKDNFEEVTSEEFVEEMVQFDTHAISYGLFMPVSSEDGHSLTISTEQVKKLIQWGEYIRTHYPIYPFIGTNGSDIVTACLAAERRIHITANGDVEPCTYCHWAADNIKDKTILEVMNSEFFQLIRGFNSTGETVLNPCKVANSIFLQKAFQMTGAHPTTIKKGGKTDVWKRGKRNCSTGN